ncbi:MAG: HupE/UreJ family protein [Nitrospirae bacterium]|nr:HupE/UreJ family protein [Nitrospirota bacterium]
MILRMRLLGCSLAAATIWTSSASAHTRTLSYSTWREKGDALDVTVKAPWIEFERAMPGLAGTRLSDVQSTPDVAGRVDHYLRDHLSAVHGSKNCASSTSTLRAVTDEGTLVGSWKVVCEKTGTLELITDLFFDAAPSHVHVARFEGSAGVPGPMEKIMVAADRTWMPRGGPPASRGRAGFMGFLRVGLEHILTGYDHLLFLAGLVLLGLTWGRLAGLVTGFTAAHSLSLAAATLGWVRTEGTGVESLIGFSIAIVALESFAGMGFRAIALTATGIVATGALVSIFGGSPLPAVAWVGMILFALSYFALAPHSASHGTARHEAGRTPDLLGGRDARDGGRSAAQWLVVFMFGLIHGFGFAGALLSARLEGGDILPALLGFNVGVELGQIGVLLALVLIYKAASKIEPMRRHVGYACASVVLAWGLFWFWSRLAA